MGAFSPLLLGSFASLQFLCGIVHLMLKFELLEVLLVLVKFYTVRVNVSSEYITLPFDSLGSVNDFDKLVIWQTFHKFVVVQEGKVSKVIVVLEELRLELPQTHVHH